MGQYLSLLTKVKESLYQGNVESARDQLKYLLNLINGDYRETRDPIEKDKCRQVIMTFLPVLDDLKKGLVSDVVIRNLKLNSSLLAFSKPKPEYVPPKKESFDELEDLTIKDDDEEEKVVKPSKPTKEDIEEEVEEKPSKASEAKSGGLFGKALRPMLLKDYYGQPRAVATLNAPIKKAILTNSSLPHILICGSYGQGKTTLARIIANEMGGNFVEVTASIKEKDLLRTLKDIEPDTIIFIDEVHKLSTDIIETLLYPAMEDYQINYVSQTGGKTKNVTLKINPFTLVGATTESGKLLKPFYSKFPIKVTLEDYTDDVISGIIKNSFRNLGISIDDDLALDVAKRSRLLPRLANAFVEALASNAIVEYAEEHHITGKGKLDSKEAIAKLNIKVSRKIVEEYFETTGIDEYGINEEERKLLSVLAYQFNGGPVSLGSLAKALNVAENRIDQEYEPYLTKLGFVYVKSQGRYVTEKALEYLKKNKLNKNEPEEIAEDEEEPLELECNIGPLNIEKFEDKVKELFSGESNEYDESLDDLFEDIDKAYASDAKNKFIVNLSNGRKIYCDSKLERRFVMYLAKNGIIQDVKSEALELSYQTEHTERRTYYPDFVFKLFNNQILIVEMKEISNLGYHLNLSKYDALKEYAKENNYLYAEIAKDFENKSYISMEQICSKKINKELEDNIEDVLNKQDYCEKKDIKVEFNPLDLIPILYKHRNWKNIDHFGGNFKIELEE